MVTMTNVDGATHVLISENTNPSDIVGELACIAESAIETIFRISKKTLKDGEDPQEVTGELLYTILEELEERCVIAGRGEK